MADLLTRFVVFAVCYAAVSLALRPLHRYIIRRIERQEAQALRKLAERHGVTDGE